MKKSFSISVISSACGIMPHTLRAWESRYNMFSPMRDEKGKRVYSEADLKKAVLLAKLVEQGHAISSLSHFKIEELQGLVSSLEDNQKDSDAQKSHAISKRLLNYLEGYDLENVSKELQYLRLNSASIDYLLNTILPTMREIGQKVAIGEYTVTQEHIMSTIIRDQLSLMTIPSLGEKNTELALATPEGNMHELSIIIANILCRAHKFNTRYLGAAHPADCLAEAVNALRIDQLILGAVSSDAWDYHKNIIPFLTDLDQGLNSEIKVVLGGGVEMKFPKFKNISKVDVIPTFEEFNVYLEKLI